MNERERDIYLNEKRKERKGRESVIKRRSGKEMGRGCPMWLT